MTTNPRARSMIKALQWREKKCRFALAKLTRTVAKERSGIEAVDGLIAAVKDRMQASLDGRFASGPRTVAALAEIEAHAKALGTKREELVSLRQQAERKLEELVTQQHDSARRLRRSESTLMHVQSTNRYEQLLREAWQSESDEEAWRSFTALEKAR
jgi:hypothetical protein